MSVYGKNSSNAKQILEILTKNNADVNAKNNDLWSPLHIAVKRGNYDAVFDILSLN